MRMKTYATFLRPLAFRGAFDRTGVFTFFIVLPFVLLPVRTAPRMTPYAEQNFV